MSQHENSARTATDPATRLPATLRLGPVHLTVSDLDRSVAFYEDAIGLRVHRRKDGVAAIGVGEGAAGGSARGPLPLRAAFPLP